MANSCWPGRPAVLRRTSSYLQRHLILSWELAAHGKIDENTLSCSEMATVLLRARPLLTVSRPKTFRPLTTLPNNPHIVRIRGRSPSIITLLPANSIRGPKLTRSNRRGWRQYVFPLPSNSSSSGSSNSSNFTNNHPEHGYILTLLPDDGRQPPSPPSSETAIGTTPTIPPTPNSLTPNPRFLRTLSAVLRAHATHDPSVAAQACAYASPGGAALIFGGATKGRRLKGGAVGGGKGGGSGAGPSAYQGGMGNNSTNTQSRTK